MVDQWRQQGHLTIKPHPRVLRWVKRLFLNTLVVPETISSQGRTNVHSFYHTDGEFVNVLWETPVKKQCRHCKNVLSPHKKGSGPGIKRTTFWLWDHNAANHCTTIVSRWLAALLQHCYYWNNSRTTWNTTRIILNHPRNTWDYLDPTWNSTRTT